jgi:hypothetical protein
MKINDQHGDDFRHGNAKNRDQQDRPGRISTLDPFQALILPKCVGILFGHLPQKPGRIIWFHLLP